ncbi:diaminopimelate decarboxylase [Anaerolineales bacterium]
MVLNTSFTYKNDELYVDWVPVKKIIEAVGTPAYIYSFSQILANYQAIQKAFARIQGHIRYSAKANANLSILRFLIQQGAGIDTVSAGEIFRALEAGAKPEDIVFAGVGKRPDEIRYALEKGIGWFNVENVGELVHINRIAQELNLKSVQVALRLNPEITANTHPYIATGHGGAKFGLTETVIRDVLDHQSAYPNLHFRGLHIHIGSQLRDTTPTQKAVQKVVALADEYESIDTLNLGGGIPVAYRPDEILPDAEAFVSAIEQDIKDYHIMIEPGRSIIANTGILVSELIYIKKHAAQTFYIVDASMTELMRPALYQAYHHIAPVSIHNPQTETVQIVGPVCETTDVLGTDRLLPFCEPGDLLAIFTAGAYGNVMASHYNARTAPVEVAVDLSSEEWHIIRQRETWQDLIRGE